MFRLYYIGYALQLLIVILSFKLIKRPEKWLRTFLVFILVHLILIVVGNTMASNGIHNFWVNQIISWWIFLTHALLFYQYLNSSAKKKFVQISTLIQILGIVLINIYIEPITTHPAYTYTIINSGIVINALLAFLQIYHDEKEPYLERLPFFWINSSIFILYFSTTILFLIRNYVVLEIRDDSLYNVVSILVKNIYHLSDILIIIGIIILRKKTHNNAIPAIKS